MLRNIKKIAVIVLACLFTVTAIALPYWENLARRQNKPENEAEFHERKDAAGNYGDLLRKQRHSNPYELENQASNNLWKKTWGDRNPVKRDLLIGGAVVTVTNTAFWCCAGLNNHWVAAIPGIAGITAAALIACTLIPIPNPMIYVNNVTRRQNKPENEAEFHERKDTAKTYGDILRKQGHSNPYELEQQVSNDLWKKTWGDRNPAKRDLLIAGTAVTLATVAGLIVRDNCFGPDEVPPGEVPAPFSGENLASWLKPWNKWHEFF
jgi:hypothetical protein